MKIELYKTSDNVAALSQNSLFRHREESELTANNGTFRPRSEDTAISR